MPLLGSFPEGIFSAGDGSERQSNLQSQEATFQQRFKDRFLSPFLL